MARDDLSASQSVKASLQRELDEAETKALDSLRRYKFQMFGYWAGIWVHLNRVLAPFCGGHRQPNPFGFLVLAARGKRSGAERRAQAAKREGK